MCIAATAAAAILLLIIGLRLHVQIDRHQVVVRWSEPPVAKPKAQVPEAENPAQDDRPA